MGIVFEWDGRKAAANVRKHGVSFEGAATVFSDPLSLSIPDPDHSEDEERFLLVGTSFRGGFLVVAHSGRGDRVRVISACAATARERRAYEES